MGRSNRMSIEDKFLNKQKFSMLIEETVLKDKISYMDAIIEVCERNNIELEEVKKYVSPSIKDKLEAEARQLNYLPKLNSLPFDDI
jgi:hypothetical protein